MFRYIVRVQIHFHYYFCNALIFNYKTFLRPTISWLQKINCLFLLFAVTAGQQPDSTTPSILPTAPPAIESCPPDSVLSAGICKCDPALCTKPPCSFVLSVAANATDQPGSCCPTYSCEGCPDSSKIDGVCPCAEDAVLDERGRCTCLDPTRTLSANGTCVCDVNKLV